tara:strand:+ start:1890 stop:2294 length:405 start_codon:yes stop_codon:yes gene_type:complete
MGPIPNMGVGGDKTKKLLETHCLQPESIPVFLEKAGKNGIEEHFKKEGVPVVGGRYNPLYLDESQVKELIDTGITSIPNTEGSRLNHKVGFVVKPGETPRVGTSTEANSYHLRDSYAKNIGLVSACVLDEGGGA